MIQILNTQKTMRWCVKNLLVTSHKDWICTLFVPGIDGKLVINYCCGDAASGNNDGLVQYCSNSSALAIELLQSCVKPSIWCNTCGRYRTCFPNKSREASTMYRSIFQYELWFPWFHGQLLSFKLQVDAPGSCKPFINRSTNCIVNQRHHLKTCLFDL